MKRFMDLRGPRSLDEAVSPATQFESFELSEKSSWLKPSVRSQRENTISSGSGCNRDTYSSMESQFLKFSSAFEERMAVFDQKMASFDARLDAMTAGSKEPETLFSPGNNYARQLRAHLRVGSAIVVGVGILDISSEIVQS